MYLQPLPGHLSGELHDTLAHTLSGLTVQLETVKAYWHVDSITAQAMLDKSLEATRSSLQETRRASPLDDLSLSLALRVREKHGVTAELGWLDNAVPDFAADRQSAVSFVQLKDDLVA